MKHVLIIGGAGYIGTVLTDHLLNAGYNVRSLDLFLYDNNHCVMSFIGRRGYESLYGNFCDKNTLDDALSGITDVVFLAGLVGDPITKKYPKASRAINDLGVRSAIQHLNGKGLNRLIFVSTCSNYGLIKEQEIADENFELKPLSLYAKAKVGAEQYLLNLNGKIDFTPTVLRFATAFGLSPRMRFDLTVSEFTRELALGKELLVYDANTWRPYCHVRDFARLITMVLDSSVDQVGFEVFNAGGDINNYTKQSILEAIVTHLPDAKIRYKEHGGDPRNYRVSFRKVQNTLGFEPKYSVTEGITELLMALKNHVFDNVEEQKNLFGNYELNNNHE
jgi:nucleoside-diphosphate-sugar epimerase